MELDEHRLSRSDLVVRALEEDILRGVRRPGERLDERQLATAFMVSRTPVREAIQRLAASGLATIRGRSGAIVACLTGMEMLDGFTVAAELEALAAAQAARRRLPAHLDQIAEAHEHCAQAADEEAVERFYTANLEFHQLIVTASQNRVLQDQLRSVTFKTSPYRRYVTYRPGRMIASIPEHAQILDAIKRSDPERAAEAMRSHVTVLGESVIDFLHLFQTLEAADRA
jgi:DNA-binding GntR family transcriptional regulator